MKKNVWIVALALAVPALAGVYPSTVVFAADKEQRQMMADIRILQEQSQQLQNLLNALNDSIKAVNARIDEQTNSARKSFADQKVVIDTLTNDLRVVREKIDDNNVRVGSLSQELEALRQTVVASSRGPADPSIAATGAAPAEPTGSPAVGSSPKQLWDGAMADWYAGHYDLAILGFQSYITAFPQAQDADDAQLYVGNSYLQQGNNDKAVEAYDALIRTYPTSNVLSDAYYKKGTALKNLKQYDQARAAFETVIKNYPDSQAATLAQQQVQGLPAPPPVRR